LGRIAGRGESRDGLIARTSLLEQAMGTAGGWQDQVGGLTGGIKLIRTDAGADQTPTLHWIALELGRRPQLAGRCLLYFTGIQRMARDILQKVVARYLRRDPELVRIVHRLKDNAEGMKRDLDAGDLDAFARRVDRYWDQKRAIDPGSTNPQIEALLEGLQGRLEARLLPGAGGGGFVFMIAKSLDDARAIRQQLTDRPPNPLARFFEWEIDPAGLSVTVL
jgi:galactokinase/mevalonate kinase-like predicted kinase